MREDNILRRYTLIIMLSLLALVSIGCKYSTLEEAIQAKWSDPIKILLNDEENNVVIFDDSGQYVFNTYKKNKQKYIYSNSKSVGVSVEYTVEHPMLIINSFDDQEIGNIIWGIVGSNDVVEIVDITLTKKGSLSDRIEMNLAVENNVFVGYPPVQFFERELESDWLIKAKAYDKYGNLIVETEV